MRTRVAFAFDSFHKKVSANYRGQFWFNLHAILLFPCAISKNNLAATILLVIQVISNESYFEVVALLIVQFSRSSSLQFEAIFPPSAMLSG